jgi:hypothetical protein
MAVAGHDARSKPRQQGRRCEKEFQAAQRSSRREDRCHVPNVVVSLSTTLADAIDSGVSPHLLMDGPRVAPAAFVVAVPGEEVERRVLPVRMARREIAAMGLQEIEHRTMVLFGRVVDGFAVVRIGSSLEQTPDFGHVVGDRGVVERRQWSGVGLISHRLNAIGRPRFA